MLHSRHVGFGNEKKCCIRNMLVSVTKKMLPPQHVGFGNEKKCRIRNMLVLVTNNMLPPQHVGFGNENKCCLHNVMALVTQMNVAHDILALVNEKNVAFPTWRLHGFNVSKVLEPPRIHKKKANVAGSLHKRKKKKNIDSQPTLQQKETSLPPRADTSNAECRSTKMVILHPKFALHG